MSTERVSQFLSNVSSDSALQVSQLSEDQLSEDQLSEDELEMVAGGVLNAQVEACGPAPAHDDHLYQGGNGPIIPVAWPGRWPVRGLGLLG